MKVPYSWLRELVPGLPADPAEVAERLTVSGTIVEAIETVGIEDPAGTPGAAFRVGRVLEFDQHPDADKLRLVQADVGEGAPRQIVCGASNFRQGDTVAVVLPGGRMPDGMEIREAKLRGVDSRGMMLSERELGLSTDHDGIMILPSEWSPGELLNDRVPLGDHVLELEVTGNRPDCLGMLGVALEAGTAMGLDVAPQLTDDAPAATAPGTVTDHVTVELEAPELCPRYMARAFVDVRVGPSPLWLKARLARAGMRSINNVVDVTNYVMLLTGQPLHAFDAEQIRGGKIVVRRAHEGETVTTLDDVERTLDPQMLVIADAERTAVIAGVMGAASVEVTADTTRLVLESACFDGLSVQRTSRALGLRSESSSRFEKGLDPHAPAAALEHATRLLVELCGASLVPGTVDAHRADLPAPPVIDLPGDLPRRILGIDVDAASVEETFRRLGFDASEASSGWRVAVPHWRMFDVTRPIDLVEELGRFRLDQIPSTLPPIRTGGAMLTRRQRLRRLLEDTAAGVGLHEVVTYGLVAPGTGGRLGHDEDDVIRLANPMTVDHAELRTSLLPGHLEVARRNAAAGRTDVAIFELGRTFHAAPEGETGDDGLPRFSRERDVLSVLVTGDLSGGRWDLPATPADFAAGAGLVEAILVAAGVTPSRRALPNTPTWLHPGQAASVHAADGSTVGWVATVHPRLAAESGFDAPMVAAQLDVAAIDDARELRASFAPFSDFPPVVEDIAVVLADAVPGGEVLAAARAAGGELVESVTVFDRYVGDPIPAGHYSLALRLVFRAPDRTLTDAETAPVRTAVAEALHARFDATLRG